MSRCTSQFVIRVVVSAASLALVSSLSRAQDPVKVAPNNYKVALDNDHVRVANVTAKAGDKVAMHSHPDHVVYAINGGKVKFTYPDGKTKEVELKAGEATFIKGETHQTENTGSTELKLVVFELKKAPGAEPKTGKAPSGDDQMKAAPESSKIVLENERVRLIDVKVKAGGKMAKHSHPSYVTYALTDAKFKSTVGDKTEEKSPTAGQAIWSDPTSHSVENAGSAEVRVLVFELKD